MTATMTWPTEQLNLFGTADEIGISTRRRDGSPRGYVPIWVVAVDRELYVRSYRGTDGAWYRHAAAGDPGAIRVGDHQNAVTFTRPGRELRAAIDAAYRTKYARHGQTYLQPMLTETAATATLQLIPQPTEEGTA